MRGRSVSVVGLYFCEHGGFGSTLAPLTEYGCGSAGGGGFAWGFVAHAATESSCVQGHVSNVAEAEVKGPARMCLQLILQLHRHYCRYG